MLKKFILFIAIILTIYGCKKENKGPQYDITGTWVISSISINGQTILASDYPCIANDSLVFGSNGSAMVRWYDATTCWINQAHTESYSAQNSLIIDYVRNGNSIYMPAIGSTPAGYGTIANVNSKLQLTLRDTNRINTAYAKDTIYQSSVYTKQ